MTVEIDNYPVSQLQSRYSLGKQAIYNRLDALDIKPSKEGNRSYLTAEKSAAAGPPARTHQGRWDDG